MLNLATTGDLVQVVTSSAATIDVFASWVKFAPTITPGNTLATAINSATTTTVVPAPGSGEVTNVRLLVIRNTHASLADDITIQVTNGTLTRTLLKETLQAGESIWITENGITSYLATGVPKLPDTLNLAGVQSITFASTTPTFNVGEIEFDG